MSDFYKIILNKGEDNLQYDFNENYTVYIKLANDNQYYKVERIDGDTSIIDYINGDSIRIYDYKNKNITSYFYDKNGNKDIKGSYIKIDNTLIAVENYYQFIKISDEDLNKKINDEEEIYIDFYQNNENNLKSFYFGKFYYDKSNPKKNILSMAININNEVQYSYLYKKKDGCGIYSYSHTNFEDQDKGFYLGSAGLSIYKNILFSADDGTFKISDDGGDFKEDKIYLGNDGFSINNNKIFFAIKDNEIQISEQGRGFKKDSLYFGNNGLSLGGTNFWVDKKGNLFVRNLEADSISSKTFIGEKYTGGDFFGNLIQGFKITTNNGATMENGTVDAFEFKATNGSTYASNMLEFHTPGSNMWDASLQYFGNDFYIGTQNGHDINIDPKDNKLKVKGKPYQQIEYVTSTPSTFVENTLYFVRKS